jgi:hypothetical protein
MVTVRHGRSAALSASSASPSDCRPPAPDRLGRGALAILALAAPACDYFGYSVALPGETALVGASSDTVGVNVDQGRPQEGQVLLDGQGHRYRR